MGHLRLKPQFRKHWGHPKWDSALLGGTKVVPRVSDTYIACGTDNACVFVSAAMIIIFRPRIEPVILICVLGGKVLRQINTTKETPGWLVRLRVLPYRENNLACAGKMAHASLCQQGRSVALGPLLLVSIPRPRLHSVFGWLLSVY